LPADDRILEAGAAIAIARMRPLGLEDYNGGIAYPTVAELIDLVTHGVFGSA
jgi:hypothetical protein